MAIRIPWSKHEVALLIEACVRYNETHQHRTEIISELSKTLRELAIKNHVEIDDIYRNENGITMQFTIMQALLQNKESGLHSASKLFDEMKELYYQNNSEYKKILKEAHIMLEGNKKNQDAYIEWLSNQVSPAQLSELYLSYEKIDKFCLQRGILKKPLMDTTDTRYVQKVLQTVEQNKVFKFTHKREINKIISAVRYYLKYIKSKETNETETQVVSSIDISVLDEKNNSINKVVANDTHKETQAVSSVDISLISRNNVVLDNITRTKQDEYLLAKYPIAYKKVMESLRTSARVVGEKGVTPHAIYENIKHIARIDDIEYILENASWAKSNGSRYAFSQEIIHKNAMAEETPITPLTESSTPSLENIYDAELEPYKKILEREFSRGFRLGSAIEIRKFKRYWFELNNTELELTDEKIEGSIKKCGVVYDGRVYAPSFMISDELKSKVLSYINRMFDTGVNAIFFESIFNEFSDDFMEYCMYNADMLKEYIKFVNNGQYHISEGFISKDADTRIDPTEEVKQFLIDNAVPMTYEVLYESLPHITPQRIRQALNFNSDFISNARNEYFHIDITVLPDEYLENISRIISDAICDKKFISGNELIEAITVKYPHIIENNGTISSLGLRNAIGYKLKNKFSFEGNIISNKNEHLSMMDVFAEFCKKRASFTLDELKMLKQELNTTIYFDAVYENSLRISQTNFVSKEQACFDTTATDAAIDRFCTEEYLPIAKINQFGSFPDAGFQWNEYLLEHYVAMYSPNYKLVHGTFNETACVGGIVKKTSKIESLDELVIDALYKSHINLNKEQALQFLCDEGYLARRQYTGIEELLIKANELRNQKGN